MHRKVLSIAAALVLVVSGPALAETGSAELQIMARAVGFVSGLPRGAQVVAIVDGPGAAQVMHTMGASVSAGGITLIPRLVSVDNLASSGARIIIVPEGQRAQHAAIATAAAHLNAISISTDMSCVRSNYCVVGVATRPRTDIIVSTAARDMNRVRFAQAFRIMFREV